MQKKKNPQVIFADLKDDSERTSVSQLAFTTESLCINCEKNGQTTMMLTKIPFFRQVVIVSFLCDECGYRNNEVQFAGSLPDFGVEILFRVMNKEDLNREVIRSEYCKINFDQIDFEIPPNGRAQITTIESLLLRTHDELNFHQNERKVQDPESYQKIQGFLVKLRQYLKGETFPITIKLYDPSGNSNIKNPFMPKLDKNMQISHFQRTIQQLVAMGYSPQNAHQEAKGLQKVEQQKKVGNKLNFTKPFEQSSFLKQESVEFDVTCHACYLPGKMKTCETSIPYFTDLVIMSFSCEYCGAHNTQTKSSGQISQNACQITLTYDGNQTDLKRDIFKSETCSVNIPEIELELDYGTLGGCLTTVEGLLENIHNHLNDNNPFADSDQMFATRMKALLADLKAMQEGQKHFTMILVDPFGKSFMQNPYFPKEDIRMKRIFRPRNEEQNQWLGLNDIKVQNYGQSKQQQVEKKQEVHSEEK